MVEEKPRCRLCGAELKGRDVYEGKCSACREKEVLYGEGVLSQEKEEIPERLRCPNCARRLPEKGRFCLECGQDLYEVGFRHPPSRMPYIVLAVGVVLVGYVSYRVWRSSQPQLTPWQREVLEATRNFLELIRTGKYRRAVDKYFSESSAPEKYAKYREFLRSIDEHSGFLQVVSSSYERIRDIATTVSKYPEYCATFVKSIADVKGRLRQKVGRTDRFLAWWLEESFSGVDLSSYRITVEVDEGEEGERAIAKIRYAGTPKVDPAFDDPRSIEWVKEDDHLLPRLIEEPHFNDIKALLNSLVE